MASSHEGRRVGLWSGNVRKNIKIWLILQSNAENQRAYRERQKDEKRQLEEEKKREEDVERKLSNDMAVEEGKAEVWSVVAGSFRHRSLYILPTGEIGTFSDFFHEIWIL